MTTGEKIRQARKEAGLSQLKLGLAVDTYVQTISKIENDRFCPNHNKLMQIAKALNKPPEYFGWEHVDPKDVNLDELTPGQIVKLHRTHENMSLQGLANLTGTYVHVIRDWESDIKIPKNEIIRKAAAHFELDPIQIGHPKPPDLNDPIYDERPDLLIRCARMYKGLTHKALGDKLGVTKQAVSQWEHELVQITPETAKRLAIELDIPVEMIS